MEAAAPAAAEPPSSRTSPRPQGCVANLQPRLDEQSHPMILVAALQERDNVIVKQDREIHRLRERAGIRPGAAPT
eukprot:g10851.t1